MNFYNVILTETFNHWITIKSLKWTQHYIRGQINIKESFSNASSRPFPSLFKEESQCFTNLQCPLTTLVWSSVAKLKFDENIVRVWSSFPPQRLHAALCLKWWETVWLYRMPKLNSSSIPEAQNTWSSRMGRSSSYFFLRFTQSRDVFLSHKNSNQSYLWTQYEAN